MLPDQGVGTFLSMTGTGGNEAMVIKTLVSAFVLDLALNNTSWINYTNVCQVMDNLMADMERNAYLRRPHFTPHIWKKGKSSLLTQFLLMIWWRLWCNGYHRRKWTRRPEFKSRTRLFVFHKGLIPLKKVLVQLFFLHLWVNSRADWDL